MRKVSKKYVVLGVVLVAVASGMLLCRQALRPTAKDLPGAIRSAGFSLGPGLQFKNLTVFPVLSPAACDDDSYLTLDEGLVTGKVVVTEIGARVVGPFDPAVPPGPAPPLATHNSAQAAGQSTNLAIDPFADPPPAAANDQAANNRFEDPFADVPPAAANNQADNNQAGSNQGANMAVIGDVNHVLVLNTSDKPLYLMPGEIIVGGLQDRCVAQETIVPPGQLPVSVAVFCVEHGRWSGRAGNETAVLAQQLGGAPISDLEQLGMLKRAESGQFVRGEICLSKPGRHTVQGRQDQVSVWDEVAKQNMKTGAMSSSCAFTANFSQRDVVARLQDYVTQLQKPIADQPRVVGVVVAINGKPEMADVFASTPLFRRLWPKLLKSYALDAAGAEQVKDIPCMAADALGFLDHAAAAQLVPADSDASHGLLITRRSSGEIESFAAQPAVANYGTWAADGFDTSQDQDAPAFASGMAMGGMGQGRLNVNRQGAGFAGSLHSSAFAK